MAGEGIAFVAIVDCERKRMLSLEYDVMFACRAPSEVINPGKTNCSNSNLSMV